MSSQFIFSLKCYVALDFTDFVRANEVGLSEMLLQVFVFFVVYIFMLIPTEMASKMFSVEVLEKLKVTE